jgi:hypothetical protein
MSKRSGAQQDGKAFSRVHSSKAAGGDCRHGADEQEIVATPLVDLSKRFLRERGNFLPHAAILNALGKVALVGGKTEHDLTNSAEVGIAENANITVPGQSATDAIKVLFEHRRGLIVCSLRAVRQEMSGWLCVRRYALNVGNAGSRRPQSSA